MHYSNKSNFSSNFWGLDLWWWFWWFHNSYKYLVRLCKHAIDKCAATLINEFWDLRHRILYVSVVLIVVPQYEVRGKCWFWLEANLHLPVLTWMFTYLYISCIWDQHLGIEIFYTKNYLTVAPTISILSVANSQVKLLRKKNFYRKVFISLAKQVS